MQLSACQGQPGAGVGLDHGRRRTSGVSGSFDALHGGVRRHPDLDALARRPRGQDGKEMLDGRSNVVSRGESLARRSLVDSREHVFELGRWELAEDCGHGRHCRGESLIRRRQPLLAETSIGSRHTDEDGPFVACRRQRGCFAGRRSQVGAGHGAAQIAGIRCRTQRGVWETTRRGVRPAVSRTDRPPRGQRMPLYRPSPRAW